MTKLAIITAAGWKGTSSVYPGIAKGMPEPLLPLGKGVTILSRHVAQLRALGYIVFAGVGQPGSLYSHMATLRWCVEGIIDEAGAEEGARPPGPWTWPRVEYVRKIGAIPVLISNPSSKGLHYTIQECMRVIGLTGWDELLVTLGDYVFRDDMLMRLLELPFPVQIWMTKHPPNGELRHQLLRLDVKCAKAYMTLQPFNPYATEGVTDVYDLMKKTLADAGAPIVWGLGKFPTLKHGWMDVDYPVNYAEALRRVKEGLV